MKTNALTIIFRIIEPCMHGISLIDNDRPSPSYLFAIYYSPHVETFNIDRYNILIRPFANIN